MSPFTLGTLAEALPPLKSFMTRLELAEHRIETRPKAYRTLQDCETRRYSFRINRTTYLVDYRIEPGEIVILRGVWHGRQNRPG